MRHATRRTYTAPLRDSGEPRPGSRTVERLLAGTTTCRHDRPDADVGADVDTVIVGGEVLMQGRSVERVDVEDVMAESRQEQARAFARVGIDPVASRQALWGATRYPDGPGTLL